MKSVCRFLLGCGALLLGLTVCAGQTFAKEKYIVASDCTWPPMEFLNDQKQVQGYSTDFIRAVAEAVGIEVEVRNIAWDGIFGGVATGQYDIVASSTTITEERKKQFDFTDPYFEVHQAVIVPAGKQVSTLADLKGKKVGGQIATTGIFVMRNAKVDCELKEYDDVGLAIQDLVGGRIDAVICDDPVAMYYVNMKKDYAGKLNLSFKTEDKELYGFTIKKGREDLLKKLNEGIAKVKAAGLDKEFAKKWMGQ
ncbi:MAG: basic amino acid ABC transporter substrate-binding protein [Desulfovibrio sp.]|nr:basic amino acid ABC transporter substrate-binding protein [Desulfovibrio sp.]